jgi:hypothetical protein
MMQWMGGAESGVMDVDYSSQIDCSTSQKRTGAYAYHASVYSGAYLMKNVIARDEFFVQVAYFPLNGYRANPLIKWKYGSTVLGTLYINADGTLKLCTGDSDNQVAVGNTHLPQNAWSLIELHVKIADSGGVIEAKLNGLLEASFTGDTKPGTETTINNFEFWCMAGNWDVWLDDIIINDATGSVNNSWPGGLKVLLLKPNGAGSSAEWTPSAGSNFQCVDEVPVSAADYVSVNEDAKLDLYTLEDLPAEAAVIAAIKADAWAWKVGAPVAPKLKNAIRLDGVNYLSTAQDLPSLMGMIGTIWETDPGNPGTPFTVAQINAMEAGVQSST